MLQKRPYRYSTGEAFEADTEDLERLLRTNLAYIVLQYFYKHKISHEIRQVSTLLNC